MIRSRSSITPARLRGWGGSQNFDTGMVGGRSIDYAKMVALLTLLTLMRVGLGARVNILQRVLSGEKFPIYDN